VKRDTLWGELWAEFFGTLTLIVFGCGVVANVLYAPRLSGFGIFKTGAGYGWDTIAFGWAFAVALAVYVAGGITGAHINPAVTFAAILRRGMPVGKGIGYMVAQTLGAFLGAFIAHMAYLGSFIKDGYMNIFYTGAANPGYSLGNSFFVELVATAFLVLFIYAIGDNVNNVGPGANLWPFMVGMAILLIGLGLGGPTGYALNPARDLGPRIYAALIGDTAAFQGPYWFLVPIVATLLGGGIGAYVYDFGITPFLPKAAGAKEKTATTAAK